MRFAIFLLCIILCSVNAFAKNQSLSEKKVKQLRPPLNRTPQSLQLQIKKCYPQFLVANMMRDSDQKWIEQAPTQAGAKTYRSPTRHFGRWLEVTIDASGAPTLYEVTNQGATSVTFDSECRPQSKNMQALNFEKLEHDSLAKWMDDQKLKDLISSGKSGLIYVWSPEMVYSAKYYRWFRDTAKEMGLKFIPILDPRCKLTDVDKMSKLYGIEPDQQKLNSVELYMRNLTVHYPTSLVFKKGQLSDEPIVGVMPKDQLKMQILYQLNH